MHYRETQYGFEYGAAEVTRLHSVERTGAVIMQIGTPRGGLQIHVTKTGKIRVFDLKRGELKASS